MLETRLVFKFPEAIDFRITHNFFALLLWIADTFEVEIFEKTKDISIFNSNYTGSFIEDRNWSLG